MKTAFLALCLLTLLMGCKSAEYQTLDRVAKLKTAGELFTQESVQVILAEYAAILRIDEATVAEWAADHAIKHYDIYPVMLASAHVSDDLDIRRLARDSFDSIAHPQLKFFWAHEFFQERTADERMKSYLIDALDSKPKWLRNEYPEWAWEELRGELVADKQNVQP